MAQCDFYDYTWSSGHYCKKEGKSIDKYTVDSYCDSSLNYRNCPIYNASSGSSGCYLTTACVNMKNLPDDCRELTVLREFRDGFMSQQSDGEADIQEYYKTAPKIVESINCQCNKDEIYEKLYDTVIVPCVELIENGRNDEAYDKYKRMVQELEKNICRYLKWFCLLEKILS